MEKFLKTQHIVERFVQFAQTKGVKRRNNLIKKSYSLLEKNLVANIVYNILGMEEHIKYLNKSDKTVQTALSVLEKGESFPAPPLKDLADDNTQATEEESQN